MLSHLIFTNFFPTYSLNNEMTMWISHPETCITSDISIFRFMKCIIPSLVTSVQHRVLDLPEGEALRHTWAILSATSLQNWLGFSKCCISWGRRHKTFSGNPGLEKIQMETREYGAFEPLIAGRPIIDFILRRCKCSLLK